MPIYEFECRECHRKTTAIVMVRDRVGEVRCKKCGSANLEKLFSRFAMPKSEDARLESLADPSAMSGIENDPKSVARFMKKMGQEMGEDFGGDIDQAIEEEMAGGGPDSDGGNGSGGGGGDEGGGLE